MRATKRVSSSAICPDCRKPLWMRKSKGVLLHACMYCGQSFQLPRTKVFKGIGNGLAAEQLELELESEAGQG